MLGTGNGPSIQSFLAFRVTLKTNQLKLNHLNILFVKSQNTELVPKDFFKNID